jgi:hypothetical protein
MLLIVICFQFRVVQTFPNIINLLKTMKSENIFSFFANLNFPTKFVVEPRNVKKKMIM